MRNESSRSDCCEETVNLKLDAKPQEELELARLAKALGNPARVRILRVLIAQQSCIAGDLQAEVGLAASTVSQHLKRLKQAGWIQGEVDGPRRCYCINPETRRSFESLIGNLL
ncbi:MAG: metalloregulator ArsR/SmtB family transcription factor [Planctomycetota bacterium]